jgi:uncharacterized membrane protein YbaN (DUF454 family)
LYRLVKLIGGWILVILGVVGWFMLIVPGTPLIILGLTVLSGESPWVRKKIEAAKLRFPRLAASLEAIKNGIVSRLKRRGQRDLSTGSAASSKVQRDR